MIADNKIPLSSRLKELVLDWLVICLYLISLFLLATAFYHLVLGSIPRFSEIGLQIIATLTSVLPITLFFSYLDYRGGSWGKRRAGLAVYFSKKSFGASLLRNIVKFLPWQIGHMATIHGIYSDFDSLAILLDLLAIGLLVTLFLMGIFRKDKRHLGDLLAGTQVQKSSD